jgi:phosphoserine phosphatase
MGTDPISEKGSVPISNLVIQGPSLSAAELDTLIAMTKPGRVEPIADRAFRLKQVKRNDIAAWCDARRIDHAWMPDGRRFAELRLLAMDMDSTLITIECIDELGDLAGKKTEIAAITARAMRGDIDYPESLRRRVAMLAGLNEKSLAEIYEKKLRLTSGAEQLLAACKKHGVKLLLVSGGFTFFTERLKTRLSLDYTISNTLEIVDGRLTGRVIGDIVGAEAKAARFLEVMRTVKTDRSRTVAIGDGANDLKMMAEAGLSVAFHAKPVVRAQAACALTWSGLDGVVNLFE